LAGVPAKQCSLDPAPTWLLKKIPDTIAPIIANMCNVSIQQKLLPPDQKNAITVPRLKKPSLDPDDLNSYRPITNLSFVSKVVERVVDSRLVEHCERNRLFPEYQSAYRAGHSTETALVHLYNEMLREVDRGQVGALMLLDMSAAFDTVDHDIMLTVLERGFGVQDHALEWFRSYFADRNLVVSVASSLSKPVPLSAGVPQGSVIGPKSFIAYTADVQSIFIQYSMLHNMFADDMQGARFAKPSNASEITCTIVRCMTDIMSWCQSRRLQLNPGKTELLWFGTPAILSKVPTDIRPISLDGQTVQPSTSICTLGVVFDCHLSMKQHVSRVARSCYFHLRRIRSIRDRLDRETACRLVCALILTRLDYCNAMLADLPQATLAPLQRVLHAAARIVMNLRPYDHVTPALMELHWLPIQYRVSFKLCSLTHSGLHGNSPEYLRNLLRPVADVAARASLRSASVGDLVVPSTRLRMSERAFSVAGPKLWNSLPSNLKLITDRSRFRQCLKTHLYRLAYDTNVST